MSVLLLLNISIPLSSLGIWYCSLKFRLRNIMNCFANLKFKNILLSDVFFEFIIDQGHCSHFVIRYTYIQICLAVFFSISDCIMKLCRADFLSPVGYTWQWCFVAFSNTVKYIIIFDIYLNLCYGLREI